MLNYNEEYIKELEGHYNKREKEDKKQTKKNTILGHLLNLPGLGAWHDANTKSDVERAKYLAGLAKKISFLKIAAATGAEKKFNYNKIGIKEPRTEFDKGLNIGK